MHIYYKDYHQKRAIDLETRNMPGDYTTDQEAWPEKQKVIHIDDITSSVATINYVTNYDMPGELKASNPLSKINLKV